MEINPKIIPLLIGGVIATGIYNEKTNPRQLEEKINPIVVQQEKRGPTAEKILQQIMNEEYIPINPVECVSEEKVRYVTKHIPERFEEVRPHTYLINFEPQAQNGYTLGGQRTVYMFNKKPGEEQTFAIFDRTNEDPMQWKSFNNTSENIGCVEGGLIFLNKSNPNEITRDDSQREFKKFINCVYDKINN